MPDSIQFHSVPDLPELIGIFKQILPPTAITSQTISIDENTNLNQQLIPAGHSDTWSVSGVPWVSLSGTNLVGTAPETSGDTNYVLTITKTNEFGSISGTWIFTVIDSTTTVLNYSTTGSGRIHNGKLKFQNLPNVDTIKNEVHNHILESCTVEITYQGGVVNYIIGTLQNITKTNGELVVTGSIQVQPQGTNFNVVTNLKFTLG